MDVWLSVDDTEHGPDGRAWHVEVGSEVHKRLLAEGAHEVPDPTAGKVKTAAGGGKPKTGVQVPADGSAVTLGDLSGLNVGQLRKLAKDAGHDPPKNAKKVDLIGLLQPGEATDQADGEGAGGEDNPSPEGDELS